MQLETVCIKGGSVYGHISKLMAELAGFPGHEVVVFSKNNHLETYGDSTEAVDGSDVLRKSLISAVRNKTKVVIFGNNTKKARWRKLKPTNYGLKWKAPVVRYQCSCCEHIMMSKTDICPGCMAVMLE